jgi:hypothetical protein
MDLAMLTPKFLKRIFKSLRSRFKHTPSNVFDYQYVKDNGWLQGSALPQECYDFLRSKYNINVFDNDLLVVISHSCDVQNISIKNEPVFEVIKLSKLDAGVDGRYSNTKNPRILHIAIDREGVATDYLSNINNRYVLSRELLCSYKPINFIKNHDLQLLIRWITNRYSRTALPDSFNTRLNSVSKKINKLLKSNKLLNTNFYISLNSYKELDSVSLYEINLIALVPPYISEEIFDEVYEVVKNIALVLDSADGLELMDFHVYHEDEFTVDDLRKVVSWKFDFISIASESAANFPKEID